MPEGKRSGSATINPSESRPICQQSSMTTYSYPASFIPVATIASAVSIISFSLTLQANLFQLFQPIGGVMASPSNFWATATIVSKLIANASNDLELSPPKSPQRVDFDITFFTIFIFPIN